MKKGKVIISCALTGSMHTPTMSPFLPVAPEKIAEEGIAAHRAGAAILHLHARDPENGRPTPSAEVFMQFLPQLHAETDAVINISTGGGPGMTLEERLRAAVQVSPELCSLNMGCMNINLSELASRHDFKYDWEKPFLEATEDLVAKNTFRDIRHIIETLGPGGTRFEMECYEIGHLHNIAFFADKGLLKPPFLIQSVLGVTGGMSADADSVYFMRQTADRLFGSDYIWSLFGAGRHQMGVCTMGALMGSSVRVGLEDSLFISRGQLANSNADQVLKIRRILDELGLEVATAEEARQMLGLKGRANINL
ncbi:MULTISPECIES: 3-keto-5-aminohexanoate cleavage protein [unclassified Sphingobium]|uniref:3-keto-5-aminohexanoate cleavage protein n=1 Tax=unclassified Sphingobium TaxID=2611147 RepID=UPI0005CBD49B|nr:MULTISPECIES: 3-keto-5-aminohexanoate cleavage protein [unclassified Sphingobium]AJR23227.1 3-keto-5-aminohexanoate cleavage protein [Sphingobium sp. YBL2]MCB4860698.1 3-keto-5-aminohexanoate cleavage protein [Sphingobium sp. PNB]